MTFGERLNKDPKPKGPKTTDMILEAIRENSENKGTSFPTIKGYLATQYGVEAKSNKSRIRVAMKKLEEDEYILRVKPKGTSHMETSGLQGRFKINKAKMAALEKEKAQKIKPKPKPKLKASTEKKSKKSKEESEEEEEPPKKKKKKVAEEEKGKKKSEGKEKKSPKKKNSSETKKTKAKATDADKKKKPKEKAAKKSPKKKSPKK